MAESFKIQRLYFKGGRRTLQTGLTLEQAQAHCRNPETSSSTARSAKAKRLTAQRGPWFDSYTSECRCR